MTDQQREKMEELAQQRRLVLREVRQFMPIDDIVVDEFVAGFTAAIEMQSAITEQLKEMNDEQAKIIIAKTEAIGRFINQIAQLQQEVERMKEENSHKIVQANSNLTFYMNKLAASQEQVRVLREACEKIADDHFVASYQHELKELKKVAKTALAEVEAKHGDVVDYRINRS